MRIHSRFLSSLAFFASAVTVLCQVPENQILKANELLARMTIQEKIGR
jgi:hypothetical protein